MLQSDGKALPALSIYSPTTSDDARAVFKGELSGATLVKIDVVPLAVRIISPVLSLYSTVYGTFPAKKLPRLRV